jgi:tetratricopeptide (TPR) repeat protein
MSPALAERGDWERALDTVDRQIRLALEQEHRARELADQLRRADDLARRAQWPEAIAAMKLAMGLDPVKHLPWYRITPLFIEAGDIDGYDRHRRALLDRYRGTDNPQLAERAAKACLLLPGPPDVTRRAAELAGLTLVHRAEAGGLLPYYLLASGLAEYRLCHLAAAEHRLRESLATDNRSWNHLVPANLLLAMVLQEQGRRGEALARWTVAGTIFDREVPKLDRASEGDWHDVLICLILRREAESLLFDAGFPSDPFQSPGPP